MCFSVTLDDFWSTLQWVEIRSKEVPFILLDYIDTDFWSEIIKIVMLPKKKLQLTVPFDGSDDRHCMVVKYNFDLQMLFYFSYYYLETFFD